MLNDRRNIVLIGFMGCGKTTIGQLLAARLNYAFVDTDVLVARHAAMDIPLIFQKHGERFFREIEAQMVKHVCDMTKTVVATGGGVVLKSENMDALMTNGFVVYLKASADIIYENTRNDESRPLLLVDNPLEKIRALLLEREPLYRSNCHVVINVAALTPAEIIEKILNAMAGGAISN